MYLISRPAIGDERRGQPAMLGRNVAREKAPDVIAAKALVLIDQHQLQFRPQPGKRQRDQAASQAAANNRNVAFQIISGSVAIHCWHLDEPSDQGKRQYSRTCGDRRIGVSFSVFAPPQRSALLRV